MRCFLASFEKGNGMKGDAPPAQHKKTVSAMIHYVRNNCVLDSKNRHGIISILAGSRSRKTFERRNLL